MDQFTSDPWSFSHRGSFTDESMYKYLSAYLASVQPPLATDEPHYDQSSPSELDTDSDQSTGTDPLHWPANGSLWTGDGGNSTGSNYQLMPQTVAIILAGTLLSILTSAGNVMVIASFKLERQLRTISNYFLFSLAVADLTIGLISIPLMTVYTADGEWKLGYTTCQFWLSIDYLMSNASVMNLLLISCDRYFSVTRPLTYRPRRTSKKAVVMIAATFLISLVLWPPLIIAWPYIEGAFLVAPTDCVVQFLRTNTIVTLCTITVAFFGPVAIMIVLYSRVYYVTRTRQKELVKLQAFHQKSVRKSDDTLASQGQGEPRRARAGEGSSDPRAGHSAALQRIEVDAKPWGIQALLDHFSRSKCSNPSSSRKASLASSGFEEDESFSLHSGEGHPLRSSLHTRNRPTSPSASDYGSTFMNHVTQSFTGKKRTGSNGKAGRRPPRAPLHTRHSSKQLTARQRGHRAKTVSNGSDSPSCPIRELRRLSASVKRANGQASARARSRSSGGPTTSREEQAYAVVIELGQAEGGEQGCNRGPIITVHENESLVGASYLSPCGEQRPSRGKVRRLSSCSSAVSETTSAVCPPPSPLIIANRSFRVEKDNDPASTAVLSRLAVSMGGIASRLSSMRGYAGEAGDGSAGGSGKGDWRRKRRGERRQQESKAARTLSAILLAFIVTWTPYSLIVCIESFCPNYVPASWFTFGYYLCYLNSTINPFLYALCNATFRRTFWRIMTGKWTAVKHTHRPSSHHHAAAAIAAVAVAAARRHSGTTVTTLR